MPRFKAPQVSLTPHLSHISLSAYSRFVSLMYDCRIRISLHSPHLPRDLSCLVFAFLIGSFACRRVR